MAQVKEQDGSCVDGTELGQRWSSGQFANEGVQQGSTCNSPKTKELLMLQGSDAGFICDQYEQAALKQKEVVLDLEHFSDSLDDHQETTRNPCLHSTPVDLLMRAWPDQAVLNSRSSRSR
jgi:hypothetical protein